MKANELRVGNWIFDNISATTKRATWVHIKVMENDEYFAEPIPLSHEWFYRMGFIFDSVMFEKDNIRIGHYKDGFCLVNGFDISDKVIEIKYIHQLQNIYFALTNEELTLK